MSNTLTVQYDPVIYLLDKTEDMRALIHRYVDVYEYPDGGSGYAALLKITR